MFTSFYKIAQYPRVPGLGSFLAGRIWEKGGYIAHLRIIEDDDGRAMVSIKLEYRHRRWPDTPRTRASADGAPFLHAPQLQLGDCGLACARPRRT